MAYITGLDISRLSTPLIISVGGKSKIFNNDDITSPENLMNSVEPTGYFSKRNIINKKAPVANPNDQVTNAKNVTSISPKEIAPKLAPTIREDSVINKGTPLSFIHSTTRNVLPKPNVVISPFREIINSRISNMGVAIPVPIVPSIDSGFVSNAPAIGSGYATPSPNKGTDSPVGLPNSTPTDVTPNRTTAGFGSLGIILILGLAVTFLFRR